MPFSCLCAMETLWPECTAQFSQTWNWCCTILKYSSNDYSNRLAWECLHSVDSVCLRLKEKNITFVQIKTYSNLRLFEASAKPTHTHSFHNVHTSNRLEPAHPIIVYDLIVCREQFCLHSNWILLLMTTFTIHQHSIATPIAPPKCVGVDNFPFTESMQLFSPDNNNNSFQKPHTFGAH